MRFSSLSTRTLVSAAALLVVAAAGSWWAFFRPSPEPVTARWANPSTCAACHPAIAATYRKTGMGRAFHKVTQDTGVGAPAPSKPFYHAASGSYFDMVAKDGVWYQRRWQKGFDGKETNVDEKRVDYILGSGNHSRTFLHQSERNTVQELPLGWYAEKGGYWDMNPGYDRADNAGSVRPIFYECMFCHNGYPKIPEGDLRDASQASYLGPLPEGIDCQRCHGPGQDHVDKASKKAPAEAVRASIVNPARLNPDREAEVCLQCHLETSSEKLPHAVVRLERVPFSYQAGQSLADFMVVFDREPGKNTTLEVAQASAYQFRRSECFLKTQDTKKPDGTSGALRCTTCHNPHDIPRGEPAAKQYNQVCAGCHPTVAAEAKTVKAKIAEHKPGANCVNCHMPKRRTDDAVHVVMTDHYIRRRPVEGNLLAAKAEKAEASYQGQVVPYYPAKLASTAEDDLTLAVAQVREQSNLKAGISMLAASIEKYHPKTPGYYAELAEAYLASGDTASAIRFFEQASGLDPKSAPRLIQWGDALGQAGQWPVAESKHRKATELAPSDPRAWGRLGWALWQQDKGPDAKAALEKAIALDPEIPEIHNNLGLVLWGTSDRVRAEAEFREALRIQPGVAEWRANLARALASQGRIPEALFQMEESVRLKPDNVEGRLLYAQMLVDSNRSRDAEAQAKAAASADPKRAEAHEMLGDLLARRGDFTTAVSELRAAVQLQPSFGKAHFELGMALGARGDSAGAREQLGIAAQSSDPQVAGAARQRLQQMR